ncbi:hypothetical protein HYH03_000905 [Edaphochlamys debaryana]|uniref:Histone chaperone RTT106/FACT complex subunit SPT16-like middle domain-containing protein n=1 Tax=Edaphochlamys debaryana TaxID=47281 RepID=A0A836C6U4_9CHLO|nr:hypothetical protein HYH03_000905 [Edaphochlamys debaryana]|eukprot:KAG2501087.1 hypothetical protein HYH03_000905 [Edaphochlamys debaryana]
MASEARALLSAIPAGRAFLEVAKRIPETALANDVVVAASKLLGASADNKENLPTNGATGSAPGAPADVLVTIPQLQITAGIAKGKYDISFSLQALTFSNAKTSIAIPTSAITHVAILDQIPQDTRKRCLLVIALNRSGPAAMNGKQRLQAVVIQTLESDTLDLVAPSGEALQGPTVAVVCQAVGMAIPDFANFLAPSPELYTSAKGNVAVGAVVGASQGFLFPLEGALLFAERPPLLLPHVATLAYEVRRPQSSTCDLVVHMREGDAIVPVEFSQVEKAELGRLISYFERCRIKPYDPSNPPKLAADGAAGGGGSGTNGEDDGDGDSDDEDDSEDDEDFDPSALERLESGGRAAKRARTERSGAAGAGVGPSSSGAGSNVARDVAMRGADEDDAEEEEAEAGSSEDEGEEDSDDDDEDSYDEEEELADLTDEDDVPAEAVRARAKGGKAAAGGGGAGGSGAGGKGRGGRAQPETDEDDEEEDDE